MSRVMKVGVIGAGSWGTTLAKVSAENGHDTLLWARRPELAGAISEERANNAYLPGVTLPESLNTTSDLEHVTRHGDLLLLVVPSHGLRDIARELGQFANGGQCLIHATKGLEQVTHKRMSEVLREETCVRKIGVLAGPNLARELAQCGPAGTLVASAYDEVFHKGHSALGNHYFRVYWGSDVVGAEVGGAFKNVVALAAGVLSGLGFGENSRALLLTRGLSEMTRLGRSMGADPVTFSGMAGVGDLIATCSSSLSRNFQVGSRLAGGESLRDIQTDMSMVAEGVKTALAVDQFCAQHRLELPIAQAIHRLLYAGGSVPQLLTDLMAIPTGAEF